MTITAEISSQMLMMRDDAQARHLQRFFKCGKGEYGEGDQFLGLRVPVTRSLVKEYRSRTTLNDTLELIESPWHEVRLAGFLLMVELYRQGKRSGSDDAAKAVVDAYVKSLHRANNWDLVDLSASYILGDRLLEHPEERHILFTLAQMDGNLWHQRVAIVATWALICNGIFADTIDISERYLTHRHDLIHKATGWMLREMGKRGGHNELRAFLNRHASKMPRTMLRYAIEKFPEQERRHYLAIKKQKAVQSLIETRNAS